MKKMIRLLFFNIFIFSFCPIFSITMNDLWEYILPKHIDSEIKESLPEYAVKYALGKSKEEKELLTQLIFEKIQKGTGSGIKNPLTGSVYRNSRIGILGQLAVGYSGYKLAQFFYDRMDKKLSRGVQLGEEEPYHLFSSNWFKYYMPLAITGGAFAFFLRP